MDEQTQQAAWDGIVRRHVDITVRSVDEKARSIDVVASTASLDSHSTILEQDWRLERYRKNPVVLWNHNRFEHGPLSLGGGVRPVDFLPIGRSEHVGVVNNQLEARIVFASAGANPLAEQIFQLMREGVLRSVSVGFRPGSVTEESIDGREILRLAKNELYEISVVPVPSNPDAVARSIAWEREHLGRIAAAGNVAVTGAMETRMAMTPEEKAAYDAALARAAAIDTELAAAKASVQRAEAAATKLEAELKSASERAQKAEERVIDAEIGKLVNTKFYPAEREEMTQLAREIGLERVQRIAAARPDIKLTEGVTVDGKALTSANQPAPAPADGSAGGGGDDIVKSALAAAGAAA